MNEKLITHRNLLRIPHKIQLSIRLVFNNNPVYESTGEFGKSITLSLFPYIDIKIIRESEYNENGQVQRIYNPNDTLSMSRYTLPLFIKTLEQSMESLKIQDMFVINSSNNLELNPQRANENKRACQIGNMYVEVSPCLIKDDNNKKDYEGLKILLNKEPSSFSLTLNDLTSLLYTLNHIDIDSISEFMYKEYYAKKKVEITNPPF